MGPRRDHGAGFLGATVTDTAHHPDLDPDEFHSTADLAAALTELRTFLGLTVREVSRTTGIPNATLGGWFSGRHLPPHSQPEAYDALLAALGVPAEGRLAWRSALLRLRRMPGPRRKDQAAPYRGLESYGVEHAGVYVGREAEVQRLVDQVVALTDADGPRVVAVIGPSGSGKSSLLHAGLLATVTGRGLATATLTVDEVAAGAGSGTEPSASARVIVVDQLEQVLTDRFTTDARTRVLEQVRSWAGAERTVVVVGLRADFLAKALTDATLGPLVRGHQVLLTPLDRDALRRVIVEPAERAGRPIEEEAVDLALRDVAPPDGSDGSVGHGAASTLPLLSHALMVAWEQAGRARITATTYVAAGGVRGGVEASAEAAYASLDAATRVAARRLFRMMVIVDADGVALRRPVDHTDLAEDPELERAADAFVERRILTAQESTFEISHEVVLVAWARLREWLADDQGTRLVQHRIALATRAWDAHGQDPGSLLRGAVLAEARALPPERRQELTAAERTFLDASAADADAVTRRERRGRIRLQVLAACAVALALLTGVTAAYLFDARGTANDARASAEAAQRDALSRQVAAEARLTRAAEPSLAAQLAAAAYRISPTLEARSALLEATGEPMVTRLTGPEGPSRAIVSPDGRTLAIALADGTVRLHDIGADGRPRREAAQRVQVDDAQLYASAYDDSGRLLAVGSASGTVALYDVSSGRATPVATAAVEDSAVLALLVHDGVVYAGTGAGLLRWRIDGAALVPLPSAPGPEVTVASIALAPDGRLVTGSDDGTARVWRVGATRLREVRDYAVGSPTNTVTAVAVSSDGSRLATGSKDKAVRIWDLAADRSSPLRELAGAGSWVNGVAWTPDGGQLAAGASGANLLVWDTADWRTVADVEPTANISSVTYTPDGEMLVTSSTDGSTRFWPRHPAAPTTAFGDTVWNLGAPDTDELYASTGSAAPVIRRYDVSDPAAPVLDGAPYAAPAAAALSGSASVSRDGRLLAGGTNAGELAVWRTDGPRDQPAVVPVASDLVEATSFTTDGATVAVASDDGTVTLVDVTGTTPRTVRSLTVGSIVLSVAFSPDGHLVAAGGADNLLHLFRVADGAELATMAFDNYVYGAAFSPDGTLLAAGSTDRTVRVWNVTRPEKPRPVGEPQTGPRSTVFLVAWSPDGTRLAGASQDGAVWLWQREGRAFRRQAVIANLGSGAVSVGWLADGEALAAGGLGGTLRTWTADPDEAIAQVCALSGVAITHAEWDQHVPGSDPVDPC